MKTLAVAMLIAAGTLTVVAVADAVNFENYRATGVGKSFDRNADRFVQVLLP